MVLIYNFTITLYRLVMMIISPFNEKAALWIRGRKNFFRKWQGFDASGRKVIWFHCASLGEFEQSRPVIEEIKRRDSNVFILLTFFSPSGYEIRKDTPLADSTCYLPADTSSNARKFVETFRPDVAVFVKYEFWYYFISELKRNSIPLYLISANFRPEQIFFRWYGGWFCKILQMFSHIFVQSERSRKLLNSIGVNHLSVEGDTRFDRVHFLASKSREIPVAAKFAAGSFVLVAGSTWPVDHSFFVRFINETEHDIKLIIAPHQIDEKEIDILLKQLRKPAVRYSRVTEEYLSVARVMIIDNIGILSSLYAYGDLSYIGGGFGKNIHNILEACAHSVPVMFGPKYNNFLEAHALIAAGGAFPVKGYDDIHERINEFYLNREFLKRAGDIAGRYVESGIGASKRIVDKIL